MDEKEAKIIKGKFAEEYRKKLVELGKNKEEIDALVEIFSRQVEVDEKLNDCLKQEKTKNFIRSLFSEEDGETENKTSNSSDDEAEA